MRSRFVIISQLLKSFREYVGKPTGTLGQAGYLFWTRHRGNYLRKIELFLERFCPRIRQLR